MMIRKRQRAHVYFHPAVLRVSILPAHCVVNTCLFCFTSSRSWNSITNLKNHLVQSKMGDEAASKEVTNSLGIPTAEFVVSIAIFTNLKFEFHIFSCSKMWKNT